MVADIVAMEGDVDRTSPRRDRAVERIESGVQPAGEFDTTVGDAEQQNRLAIAVALGNGFGQPLNRSPDFIRADGLVFGHETRLWRPDVTR
jgi:hypothetical protein